MLIVCASREVRADDRPELLLRKARPVDGGDVRVSFLGSPTGMEDVVCAVYVDKGTKKSLKLLSVQIAAVCSL
jgi:hypothetical protein